MKRRVLLLVCLLVGLLAGTAGAGTLNVVVEGRQGLLRGQLPLVVGDDGSRYVSLDRLARLLRVKPTWTAESRRVTLRVERTTVRLIRDREDVLVQGKPLSLATPPRVLADGWVVPEEFLTRVLSRVYASVTVTEAGARPPVKAARAAVAVEDLRVRSYPSFTRVVVEAAGPFEVEIEERRDEIRARLSGVAPPAPQTEEVGDGLVREIRLLPAPGGAILHVSLEGRRGELKTLRLKDPDRIVLDVHRPKEVKPRGEPQAEPLVRIVLDAGHGGHDPGAIGPGGLQEKEVVLDVTKRVARLLEEALKLKPILTRSGDQFVPLRERTQFANKERGQLFVSIHANAHRSSGSQGVETYFLSSEASDNEARQVAALENGVVRLEPGNAAVRMDALKSILWDLAQSEFQQESSLLAETVQDRLTQSLQLTSRGIKQAGFYVLGGAAMPAILVEIGFLTNRKEERRLMDAQYREQVARAIAAGLVEYKRRYDQKMGVPQRAEAPR